MREDIVTYLKANIPATFTVSDSLPWTKDGAGLYLSNLKVVYVDLADTDQEPLIDTLDGIGIVNERVTIPIYVATDAKQLPSDYTALMVAIKSARMSSAVSLGYVQRVTDVTTEYVADNLVTQFDMTFEKLIFN